MPLDKTVQFLWLLHNKYQHYNHNLFLGSFFFSSSITPIYSIKDWPIPLVLLRLTSLSCTTSHGNAEEFYPGVDNTLYSFLWTGLNILMAPG